VATCFLGQPAHHRLDKYPDFVQNREGFDHRRLIDIAWISEHPCILCELNHRFDEWFQRVVQYDCLFAQLPQIVRLGKRLIMPHEEPLQRLFCRLPAMVQGILGCRWLSDQIYLRAPQILTGLSNQDSVSARRRASGCIKQFAFPGNGRRQRRPQLQPFLKARVGPDQHIGRHAKPPDSFIGSPAVAKRNRRAVRHDHH